MSSRPQRLRRDRRRGVTLIEVMVVSVILVVVLGILFDLLVETRRSCDKGQDILAMEDCARAAADEIVSVLETAVRPDFLDDNATSVSLRFSHDVCEVISSRHFTGQDFYLAVIGNMPPRETQDGKPRAAIDVRVLDPARMTGVAREGQRTLGMSGDRFETKVWFDYATDTAPETLEPAFESDLAPGKYPRLIRIRITVTDRDGKIAQPYELIASARLL